MPLNKNLSNTSIPGKQGYGRGVQGAKPIVEGAMDAIKQVRQKLLSPTSSKPKAPSLPIPVAAVRG